MQFSSRLMIGRENWSRRSKENVALCRFGGSYEHDNGPLIKAGKFLDQLRNCHLPKGTAPMRLLGLSLSSHSTSSG
jgi:hypothetical protein